MHMLSSRNNGFIFTAVLFLFTIGSCSPKDETCVAVIKVVGANGAALSGAQVKLTSNHGLSKGQGELADYLPTRQLTNVNGMVTFDFKYPAILDVEVTYGSSGSVVSDLIKLEPGETVQKTITFQ